MPKRHTDNKEPIGRLNTKEAVKYLRECGPTCSPRQLAVAIGGQPYSYNVMARTGKLPFGFFWRGALLRIYTEDVIKKITGGNGND